MNDVCISHCNYFLQHLVPYNLLMLPWIWYTWNVYLSSYVPLIHVMLCSLVCFSLGWERYLSFLMNQIFTPHHKNKIYHLMNLEILKSIKLQIPWINELNSGFKFSYFYSSSIHLLLKWYNFRTLSTRLPNWWPSICTVTWCDYVIYIQIGRG